MPKLGQFLKQLEGSAHVLPDTVALQQRERARELCIHSQRGAALLVGHEVLDAGEANQSVY